MAKLSNKSRFVLTKIHVDDGVLPGTERFGPWVSPEIDMTDYGQHMVNESEVQRLDLIAHRTLGDSSLWWAIAYVNKIKNPLTDVTAGMNLLIPRLEAVLAALAVT